MQENKIRLNKKNIIPQMFDVRPVNEAGDLDLEKISKIEKVAKISAAKIQAKPKKAGAIFSDIKKPDAISDEVKRFQKLLQDEKREMKNFRTENVHVSEKIPIFYRNEPAYDIPAKNLSPEEDNSPYFEDDLTEEASQFFQERQESPEIGLADIPERSFQKELLVEGALPIVGKKGAFFAFAGMSCVVFLAIFGTGFLKKGLQIKNMALNNGRDAYASLAQAKEDILGKKYEDSQFRFNEAYGHFDKISRELDSLGGILVDASHYVPYLSELSDGASLAQAGKDISRIGVLAGQLMQTLDNLKNPLKTGEDADSGDHQVSLLKIFQDTNDNAKEIQALLVDAQKNIDNINAQSIPEAQRAQFAQLKNQLPGINKFVSGFVDNGQIFMDVLGGNGPRKYLFLFQNNQEMRATGGFIGTYGVLNIFNGRIDKFFVDGIFNPDGQLREKVVPPAPIQKISVAWSLHDSNWFPNFPTSAEKATWFYEKTGGPTVDGVITMTPVVMQKLLEITGPIDMPEYEVIIDKDNFIEEIQREVEMDYDQEQNEPKKILADLAPKILDKIFNARNISDIAKTMNILVDSLNERHILIYSRNYDIEKKLSDLGWSGEILETRKDYLSVINTNINGYKTDGVIEEKIEHAAEIGDDGSVVNTVTVTRHHNGGDTQYEWWNKVNADYMRVYVPKGSKLISAEGQTREFNSPPLDYKALNFKHDAQVQAEEDSAEIDEASGTKIYEDSGKTVFANWVYVSPQETVVVKYEYLLPIKVNIGGNNNPVDTYSLLAQKQAGSAGSQFSSTISFPESYKVNWKYPDGMETGGNAIKLETDLKTDKFLGIAFAE